MRITNLSKSPSIINNYMAELRDVNVQGNRELFRTNIERIGSMIGYEISKALEFNETSIKTPLGNKHQSILNLESVVLITILRAGLPLHNGILRAIPGAENGFISAYRKHDNKGSFSIDVGYVACPNLENKILILNDPMLATGASFEVAIEALKPYGSPKSIHLAAVIASQEGVDNLKESIPGAHLWVADIDSELNSDKYIVPGLGDAGDLAFGQKLQA